MKNPINELKDKIFHNKNTEFTELTEILDLAREFSCLGELIGRDFEIMDENNNVIYKIHQKPISLIQLNNFQKELQKIKKRDLEIQQKMFGGKKGKGHK